MKWLKKISWRSPEAHEERGDAYGKKDEREKAKLEYELALEKLEKNNFIASYHKETLEKKIQTTAEALVFDYQKKARNLIEDSCFIEALDLLNQALPLTSNEIFLADTHELIKKAQHGRKQELDEQIDEIICSEKNRENPELEDDEIYFSALIESLPEHQKKAYLSFGDHFRRGLIALNHGKFETAVKDLTQAMDEKPTESFIALELASALINRNKYDEAKPLLEEFIQKHPETLPAYDMLCEIYWDKEEAENVDKLLFNVPKELAKTLEISSLRGDYYFRTGRFSEAVSIYTEILERYGWEKKFAIRLAKVHEAMDEPYLACKIYKHLMIEYESERKPVPTKIGRKFADLSFASGEHEPSLLQLYLSLVNDDPGNAASYYKNISEIFASWGDEEKSQEFYSKFQEEQ